KRTAAATFKRARRLYRGPYGKMAKERLSNKLGGHEAFQNEYRWDRYSPLRSLRLHRRGTRFHHKLRHQVSDGIERRLRRGVTHAPEQPCDDRTPGPEAVVSWQRRPPRSAARRIALLARLSWRKDHRSHGSCPAMAR